MSQCANLQIRKTVKMVRCGGQINKPKKDASFAHLQIFTSAN